MDLFTKISKFLLHGYGEKKKKEDKMTLFNKKDLPFIREALLNGEEFEQNGRLVVSYIGDTLYIDWNFLRLLTIEEIEEYILCV